MKAKKVLSGALAAILLTLTPGVAVCAEEMAGQEQTENTQVLSAQELSLIHIYHWTDPGKERDAADRDRISHCVSGTCFCGKFNRSNDDGFRDHGVNAGYGRQLYTVQSLSLIHI